MKRNLPAALLAFFVTAAFAYANDLDKQLKSDYVGKTMTLRQFYSGEHLRFHSDGTLDGKARTGAWTVDGQIAIEDIHLSGALLQIAARRIWVGFDSQHKPVDLLVSLQQPEFKQYRELRNTLRDLKVNIDIEFPKQNADEKEISSAMNAVFLSDTESIVDIVPDFWRSYVGGKPRPSQDAPTPTEPVYFIKPGAVSGPWANYAPDPEYSKEARIAKLNGTVVLWLVVGSDGKPKDIRVVRPLGLGLDEKAVEAVSTWRFRPGQKDGQPVATMVNVEVTFHLF